MRRRDRASRKGAKARRRKALTRCNASKAARGRRHLATSKETNVARLARERDEALEQQAASADVLRVISRSTFNLQTVLDTLVQSAARLCEADIAAIGRLRDKIYYFEATYGFTPEISEFVASHPAQIDRGTISGRVLLERKIFHVPDVLADPEWTYGGRQIKVGRTMLGVPLLREGAPIGVISFVRNSVRPFTDKQIELATTFADEAVIAIENTRLLNELRESLQQQTATSEVLQVISSSAGALEPVFNAMLERAIRICEASFGNLVLRDGSNYRAVAVHGKQGRSDHWWRYPAFDLRDRSGTPLDRVVKTKQAAQVVDLRTDQSYLGRDSRIVSLVDDEGARTLLVVPMLKENEVVGAIAIYREEVRPFADKQIELVKNFAAQAVIAIENARLLNDLNKLNKQLEQRVTDQVSEIERMSKLRRFLPPQVADLIVASGAEKELESHRREITALFCDLRGFTGFSEKSDPEDVMSLLREYHAAIGEIIVKYSGTLEHYAGDGVMVFFNDPIPVSNPALQAVQTALEMRMAIEALTEKWRRLGHEIGFGVGIAHGFATLGTIGFEGRFDYAAIGTVSNVASRLCDEAKPGQILISPRVLMAVEDAVKVEPVGDFTLKGISRPVAAYNVLSAVPAKI